MIKKKSKGSFFFLFIVSLFFFYLLNRAAHSFLTAYGSGIEKLISAINNVFSDILANPIYLSFDSSALLAGLAGTVGVLLVFLYNFTNQSKTMPGIEHGSAAWGDARDIFNYIDRVPENNILLTESEFLSLSSRMKRTNTDDFNRNKNVLVVGGSGSGKTRFYIKPNLMQLHSSYVIADPKGSLLHECGKMLAENGYRIKVFDLINREKSDKYNPFVYLRTADDILKLINNLITNTNSPQSKSAGDFWEKSETALLQAIFGYLLFEAPKQDQTIANALELIRLAEVKEDNENYKSPLDIIFEELKERAPDHFAVRQYDIYKFAAGKTAKSILISVGVRLAAFNIENIRNIVSGDTIGLDSVGEEKTALFVILPDTDKSFNFLAAMMFQQLFDLLVYKADQEHKGRLPFHVRFLLDEFSNIGQIPDFHILIATIRSREISVNIVLQNLAQIKSLYKDTWEIITGNCDSFLFLGGTELSTLEYVSKLCGKTTIDKQSISESKGQNASHSVSRQSLARELLTPEEVGGLKGRQCILKIRGCNPFLSRKYDIERHKNYKLLSDADSNNRFEIEDREGMESEGFFRNIKTVQPVKLSELNALI